MMVRPTMIIATKIRLMKSTLLTLGGFATTYEDHHCDNVNVTKGSSTPMDQALTCLHEIMVEIVTECDEGVSIKLYDHVISLFLRSCIKHLSYPFGLIQ
jgi:hypothetical protein